MSWRRRCAAISKTISDYIATQTAAATSRESYGSNQKRAHQTADVFKDTYGEIPEKCSQPGSASVQFEGKVQRMARVRHYGQRDRVSRKELETHYASQQLIGIDDEVMETTVDALLY